MTVYLQTSAGREEIRLPEETVWVSISTNDGNGNNTTMIQMGSDTFPCYTIHRITPEGVNVTLDCALSDEPGFYEILEQYRGIAMVEMEMFGFELTVMI